MARAERFLENFHRARQQRARIGGASHVLIERSQIEKRRSGLGVLGANEFFPQTASVGKALLRLFQLSLLTVVFAEIVEHGRELALIAACSCISIDRWKVRSASA